MRARNRARGSHGVMSGDDRPATLEGRGRLIEPGDTAARHDPGTAAAEDDEIGRGAAAGTPSSPLRIVLGADSFAFELGGGRYRHAAYRDLATVAVQAGSVLLVLGQAPGAPRLLCEEFGAHAGTLARELRDRRLRQRLADRFIELPAGEAIELVEYEGAGGAATPAARAGVAQLAYHERGFVLAPLDERLPWRVVPRGRIGRVDVRPDVGGVQVDAVDDAPVRLLRLGAAAARHGQAMTGLRDAALADAAALIEALIPDASFEARDRAASLLVDGRPADVAALGPAWGPLEAAVLAEPVFAESYRGLVARAGGPSSIRWLAMAPERPGSPQPKTWFLVALPGNLVAMELVSAGAHATYCFRVVPRASYAGEAPAAMRRALDGAVASISQTLVDIRFLREPIGLPGAALASPDNVRYRLAIAELPSLAEARLRFVARIVHDAGWGAALDDLGTWHGSCRDDAAAWPGRAAQEAAIMGLAEGPATPLADQLEALPARPPAGQGG